MGKVIIAILENVKSHNDMKRLTRLKRKIVEASTNDNSTEVIII